MSFAVWMSQPPFKFSPEDREQIYQVGSVWVVTDDPTRANQAEIDKVINQAPVAPSLTNGKLASLLVKQGILSQAAVDAEAAK